MVASHKVMIRNISLDALYLYSTDAWVVVPRNGNQCSLYGLKFHISHTAGIKASIDQKSKMINNIIGVETAGPCLMFSKPRT